MDTITNELIKLVDRAKDGDKAAFSELYKSAYKMVFLTCFSHLKNQEDAEDTAQEVFIKAYSNLNSLKDNKTFYGWVKTIAVNTSLNKIKARKNIISYDDAIESEELFSGDDKLEELPDTVVFDAEKRRLLMCIINKELSEVQYQAVIMYYYDELPIAMIANILQCPEQTIKKRLRTSRIKIRKGIEEYESRTGDKLCAALCIPSISGLLKGHFGIPSVSPIPLGTIVPSGIGAATKAGTAAKAGVTTKAGSLGLKIAAVALAVTVVGVGSVFTINALNKDAKKSSKRSVEAKSESLVFDFGGSDESQSGNVSDIEDLDNPYHPSSEFIYGPIEDLSNMQYLSPSQISVGDVIGFGYYGEEIIEWRVLDIQDGKCFLISEYALDTIRYNDEYVDITWENCTLRSWLNGEFYNNAFTPEEQAVIQTTHVVAEYNPHVDEHELDGTTAGNDTEDKVYLLSINEADAYFSSDEDRICEYSESAKRVIYKSLTNRDRKAEWWLRCTGGWQQYTALVEDTGKVSTYGDTCEGLSYAVRPVLWVSLDESNANVFVDMNTVTKIKKQTSTPSGVAIGDVIEYGDYAGQPISWIVMDVDGDNCYLLAEKAIDCRKYNDENADVTWETCSLRQWLNEDFYYQAFSESEQSRILTTAVVNDKYKHDETDDSDVDPGNDTLDKVFLLSRNNMYDYFFDTAEVTLCLPTEYALNKGCYTTYQKKVDAETCCWWLRSPGYEQNRAACTDNGGNIFIISKEVNDEERGVRPAMWVKLG